jgi:hypothetical protein
MHGVLVSDRISGMYLIPGYSVRSAPPEIIPKPEEGGENHRSHRKSNEYQKAHPAVLDEPNGSIRLHGSAVPHRGDGKIHHCGETENSRNAGDNEARRNQARVQLGAPVFGCLHWQSLR